MITPVALCHRTAWLYHHAPRREEVRARLADYRSWDEGLGERDVAERIRRFLLDCGVPARELDVLDVLSSQVYERGRGDDFCFHVLGGRSWEGLLVHASLDIYVVDEPLCLVQAAEWMSPAALLEYAFELCGDYEQHYSERGWDYVEASHRHTAAGLAGCVEELAGMRGAKRARQALSRARDGSRSPMETALALMVVSPRSDGGLGYRGIVMNERVDVPRDLRRHYSSPYYLLDVYAPGHHAALEYDGDDHAGLGRRTHDVDRASALAGMGIEVRNVTAQHFSRQLELHRVLTWFADRLGLRVDMDADFQRRQNALREFAIRRWAGRPCCERRP